MIQSLPSQFMNWVPHNPRTGENGKFPCLPDGTIVNPHDPANWITYEAAVANGLGVAFVLTHADPYFFLDLDKCRSDDGQWTPDAQAIFMSFSGAMGEVSTSGTGLHVLGKCDVTQLRDRRNKWDGWLEFYTGERFIAFGNTGWAPIGGTYAPDADWTQHLLRIVPQRTELGSLPEGVDPAYTGSDDDTVLIAKMLASTGGAGAAFGGKATVAQLWNADPILCNIYPSYDGDAGTFDHSSADAALMAHLAFWTGKDMPRMERLFRMSALMRPKFERDDYRLKTVQDAARMCNRVYDVTQREPAALPPPEVYLTIPEMIEHFDGCIYVSSRHKVLTPGGRMMDPQQFKAYYGGHIFQMNPDGTQPEKNAFVAFTENRTHRFPKVFDAEFNPMRDPGEVYDNKVNIYFPQDVVMTPGDTGRFHDIMARLLPDAGDRASLLAWMASAVQNPHRKFQWSPVLQGAEGNGKTFLMNCVAYAIGENFTHRPNPKELGATHNGWMEKALFVLVEEIHMDGRRDMLDNLKWKITNERIPIRAMATDEETMLNFSKFGFCTNYMEAVIKSQNDRRYAIYFTAQQSYDDILRDGMGGSFFPNLYAWARGGGYAAVAHYLMTYDIPAELDPAGLCHRAPRTSSTDIAIVKSLGQIETEILEATQDGTVGFRGGFISSIKLDELIRSKNLRVGRNKRTDILHSLGYIKCPGLTDGRTPMTLIWEDNKRPVLFVRQGVQVGDDPVAAYRKAQGYDPT